MLIRGQAFPEAVPEETVPGARAARVCIPTGSRGVGLGGVVLGGGFGLLTRKLGLACDNLLAAEIVVADGSHSAKVVEANAHTNSDLLWACRGGGGGNFGIATSYTLKLHELAHVEFAIARWTGHGDLGALLRTWQRDAPVADERLTSALEVDSTAIELSAVLHGGSRQELDDELRSLLAIGRPNVTYMSDAWPTIYENVDRAPGPPVLEVLLPVRQSPVPRRSDRSGRPLHGEHAQRGEQLLLLELRRGRAARSIRWVGVPAS